MHLCSLLMTALTKIFRRIFIPRKQRMLELLFFKAYLRLWLWSKGRKRVWLFTSWCGNLAGDNPMHFYTYIRDQFPDIVPVWILIDSDRVNTLQQKGMRAVVQGSILADAWAGLAEAGFYSDIPAFGSALNRSALRVNLWHGMPMKNIGKIPTNDDIVISTSTEFQRILANAFERPLKSIVVTGQPKNDALFRPGRRPEMLTQWGNKTSIITYMPTYRGSFLDIPEVARRNDTGIFLDNMLFGSLCESLSNILRDYNAILVIKPHLRNHITGVDIPRVVILDEYGNKGDVPDSHELMAITDLLITDYSSVYFDFLLTNRPFIIYAPDVSTYIETQQLFFNLDGLSAGGFAKNEECLLEFIKKFLHAPDFNATERSRLRDRFNAFTDSQSCKRVYYEVMSRLG